MNEHFGMFLIFFVSPHIIKVKKNTQNWWIFNGFERNEAGQPDILRILNGAWSKREIKPINPFPSTYKIFKTFFCSPTSFKALFVLWKFSCCCFTIKFFFLFNFDDKLSQQKYLENNSVALNTDFSEESNISSLIV